MSLPWKRQGGSTIILACRILRFFPSKLCYPLRWKWSYTFSNEVGHWLVLCSSPATWTTHKDWKRHINEWLRKLGKSRGLVVSEISCWAWTNQYVGIRVKGPTIVEPDAAMIKAMVDISGPTYVLTLYNTPPPHFYEADYSSTVKLSHNDPSLSSYSSTVKFHLIKRLQNSVQIDYVAIMRSRNWFWRSY